MHRDNYYLNGCKMQILLAHNQILEGNTTQKKVNLNSRLLDIPTPPDISVYNKPLQNANILPIIVCIEATLCILKQEICLQRANFILQLLG
ncbi:hypothetical protein P030_04970 [Anaplasma phagocytophilum str. CRT35]|nr:hypothetical protein P030_04970 [Anaplasma phagocytophilum str. CRT35]